MSEEDELELKMRADYIANAIRDYHLRTFGEGPFQVVIEKNILKDGQMSK